MAWRDGPLLGFDLETTGIDTKADLPVQVALVWTEADRVVTADTWLVNPGRDDAHQVGTHSEGLDDLLPRGAGQRDDASPPVQRRGDT